MFTFLEEFYKNSILGLYKSWNHNPQRQGPGVSIFFKKNKNLSNTDDQLDLGTTSNFFFAPTFKTWEEIFFNQIPMFFSIVHHTLIIFHYLKQSQLLFCNTCHWIRSFWGLTDLMLSIKMCWHLTSPRSMILFYCTEYISSFL